MSTQVTLTLTKETHQRVIQYMELTGRDIEYIISTTLEFTLFLYPLDTSAQTLQMISDQDLLESAESGEKRINSSRLSALLNKQRVGELSNIEQHELDWLISLYQQGLERKGQIMAELTRRGLHLAHHTGSVI